MEKTFKTLTNNIKSLKSVLDVRFDHLDLDVSRLTARTHNSRIRNPLLPIHPIVVFDLRQGKITPDKRLYPKNAREFFAMEKGRTLRDRQRLSYLIKLYEVPLDNLMHAEDEDASFPSLSYDSSTSEPGPPSKGVRRPSSVLNLDEIRSELRERAVEYLELILGLDREQIEQFEARAASRRRESPVPAAKRGLERTPNTDMAHQRRKDSRRPHSEVAASSSPEGKRMSSIMIPQSDIEAKPAKPSDWGSTTNENIRSRSDMESRDPSG